MIKIITADHPNEHDQIAVDLANHLEEKIKNAFMQAFALAETNEQVFHLAIKGFINAATHASVIYLHSKGQKLKRADLFNVTSELCAHLNSARCEVDAEDAA